MIRFQLNARPYIKNITIVIGEDEEYINYLKRYNSQILDEISHCAGLFSDKITNKNGKWMPHIWLSPEIFDWDDFQQSVITHELMHAVFAIMRYVNVEFCEQSEEAFTYLHSWLFRQFLSKFKKLERPINVKIS